MVKDIEVIDGQVNSTDKAGRVDPEKSVNDEFHFRHSVEAEQFSGFRRQLKYAQEDPRADAIRVARHQQPCRTDALLIVCSQL